MPEIDDVLADAQREIESIVDTVKTLQDTCGRPQARQGRAKGVRRLRAVKEGYGGADGRPAAKARRDCAQVQGIDRRRAERRDRTDNIEKNLNRGRLGGGWAEGNDGHQAADPSREMPARVGAS